MMIDDRQTKLIAVLLRMRAQGKTLPTVMVQLTHYEIKRVYLDGKEWWQEESTLLPSLVCLSSVMYCTSSATDPLLDGQTRLHHHH